MFERKSDAAIISKEPKGSHLIKLSYILFPKSYLSIGFILKIDPSTPWVGKL